MVFDALRAEQAMGRTNRRISRWHGLGRAIGALMLVLVVFLGASFAGRAQDRAVDLELVLAVDVSRSMDAEKQALQRDGYAQALTHPDVLQALSLGAYGRIALTYVEWAGAGYQNVVVPWQVVSDTACAQAFVAKLDAAPLVREPRTSISSGLLQATKLLDQIGHDGLRRVIDISGDGPNNNGIALLQARQAVLDRGITINGLPIMLKQDERGGFGRLADLDRYYEDCVIGGPGAFMVTIDQRDQLVPATRQKLILEVSGLTPPDGSALRKVAGTDCMIGERLWRQWMDPRSEPSLSVDDAMMSNIIMT